MISAGVGKVIGSDPQSYESNKANNRFNEKVDLLIPGSQISSDDLAKCMEDMTIGKKEEKKEVFLNKVR